MSGIWCARSAALDSYVARIADHNLPGAGLAVRHPTRVLAWLRAYACAVGTMASWEKIRNATLTATDASPAKTTTLPYIELLTMLRILDPLPAWTPSFNYLKDLTASAKHYLADPSLAAHLVKRNATQLLAGNSTSTVVPRDGGFLGGLFESLAALSVRVFAQHCDAQTYHLRTQGGRHEIDFIVESSDGILAIEVKTSAAIRDDDVRHLVWLRNGLGDQCIDTIVLHAGPDAYRRPDGVAVVPLALLGPRSVHSREHCTTRQSCSGSLSQTTAHLQRFRRKFTRHGLATRSGGKRRRSIEGHHHITHLFKDSIEGQHESKALSAFPRWQPGDTLASYTI